MKNTLVLASLAFLAVACGGNNNQDAVEATDAQAVEAAAGAQEMAVNTAASTR